MRWPEREEGDSSGPAWALSGPGPLHPGPKDGLGEAIVAQRVQCCGGWRGGSLRQSGFHSQGKTEASVCASADLIVNQPPHPAWSF